MKLILVLCLFSIYSISIFSQKIEHLESSIDKGQMNISYDLKGPKGQKFSVRFFISTDEGQNFDKEIFSAEGDVGENIKAGKGKKIEWDSSKDGIAADKIKFTLQVMATGSSPKKKSDKPSKKKKEKKTKKK